MTSPYTDFYTHLRWSNRFSYIKIYNLPQIKKYCISEMKSYEYIHNIYIIDILKTLYLF